MEVGVLRGCPAPGPESHLREFTLRGQPDKPRAGAGAHLSPVQPANRTLRRPAAPSCVLRRRHVTLPRAPRSKKGTGLLLCLGEGACVLR